MILGATLMRFLPLSTGCSSRDIAVDLGTANTVLSARGGELVVSEPTMVAVDTRTGGWLAVGREALELRGRDGIAAIRPLKDGVIVDLQGTEEMLRYLIAKVRRHRRPRPRVLASVPSGVSGVQRHAVAEACLAAGAREARLVAAPIAAALGSGLPVAEPTGSMVLDIGAGMSEVAVISLGTIVASQSIPVGGHTFDERIVTHLKRAHGVLIGEQTAEQIKLQIGSLSPYGQDAQIQILGRDMASEMLKSVALTSSRDPRRACAAADPNNRGDQGDPDSHPPGTRRRRDRARHHTHRRQLTPTRSCRPASPRDGDTGARC